MKPFFFHTLELELNDLWKLCFSWLEKKENPVTGGQIQLSSDPERLPGIREMQLPPSEPWCFGWGGIRAPDGGRGKKWAQVKVFPVCQFCDSLKLEVVLLSEEKNYWQLLMNVTALGDETVRSLSWEDEKQPTLKTGFRQNKNSLCMRLATDSFSHTRVEFQNLPFLQWARVQS